LGPLRLPGFSFREELTGKYWRLEEPTEERTMSLHLETCVRDAAAFLQSHTGELSGRIDAEGLASMSELRGTLSFKLIEEQRSVYRFTFQTDDGRVCELCGQKEWNALAPLEAITLLPASLYDDAGREVARATLRFDVRADWARWIASLRLVAPERS
jgi:hypothetical protein